ncbi:MAG: response regulator [Flavobacteriaceae bacterium]
MVNIVIADDHQMFREGLVSLLEEEQEIRILGEASNGAEALKLIEEQSPDLVLLDIEMPEMDGFDTMRALRKRKSECKVLVLTTHKSPQFIKNILKSGASGYLQKDAGKARLIEAIQTVHSTGAFYTPETGQLLIESMKEAKPTATLSSRELEIIRLISEQQTTAEIAKSLFISTHTVESHRQNILLKLGLKNSAGLVKYAFQKGLL